MSSLFGGTLYGAAGAGGNVPPSGQPVKNLFYMALRLAHITKFADAQAIAPSPDQLGDCLQLGQLMLSQAQLKRAMIYSIVITDYVLGTGEVYTLGPGGTLISTLGTSVRPMQNGIEEARLILASSGTPVYLGIHRGSYQDLANLAVQQIPGALPKFLYCDYNFPTANVYLVPQDQGGDTLELYTRQAVPTIVTVQDTVSWPEGYDDWFVHNLAVRLASVFEERGAFVTDDTRLEARRTAAAIQSSNLKSPRLSSDCPGSGRRSGDFNYFDGMPR